MGIYRSRWWPMANHAITHTFWGVLYIPMCGYHSVHSLVRLWLPQITGRAEARYPAFSFVVNQTIKNLSDSGCLADKIERNVK